ncbi:hypothetical protein [Streptomyces poriferorum]|uniref:Secreted protein n=1 Tax=Streptomyces poriferorum TaxID=2798799 RepID=A0ABY9IY90_9ACTN|nr:MULTISPECIES: hypothetical protein [unclassified Streptomyces]MDP5310358.1 hypothetical protein [Streptomyces sp. Alt4]WLQ60487.1 hypothetical protein P8A19_35920 [Streptomyces sp. Alt2]
MTQLGVAIVTASSALAGATVGGLFTLLKGRQEAGERQADRDEQQRHRRLEARRDAYIGFLKAFGDAEDELHLLYEFRVPASMAIFEDAQRPVIKGFNNLFQAKLGVEMAGPAVMAAQAQRVLDQLYSIIEEYEGCFKENKDRADATSLIDLVPGHSRLANRLNIQRDRFTGAARVQLGGDVDEVPREVLRNYVGDLARLE